MLAQTIDMDVAVGNQARAKRKNGFKRYSELNPLSKFGNESISLSNRDFNQIPLNLKRQFETMCERWDDEREKQPDFMEINKNLVKDPLGVKLTRAAQHLRNYRLENEVKHPTMDSKKTGTLRQCDCHHGLLKPEEEMFKGIINLNKRVLNGINSKNYNSIEALQDVRMKPLTSIAKTQRVTEYFRQKDDVRLN